MKHMVRASLALALFVSIACTSTEDPPVDPPSGSTAADMRILDDCPEVPCEGALEPGKYRWTFSDPTIDFEIPSPGWNWHYGGGGLHILAGETAAEGLDIADGIYFLHDPAIATRDCKDSSEPGVGRSVTDLVAWLETAPGLVVSEPTPVTVGGFEGLELDIEIDPAWERTCFFSEDVPAVPIIFSGAELGGYHWTIVPEQSLRWFILDSEDGVIIVALADDPGGLPHDELLQTGGDIVDSLEFSSS
jgi:hypothetical protein